MVYADLTKLLIGIIIISNFQISPVYTNILSDNPIEVSSIPRLQPGIQQYLDTGTLPGGYRSDRFMVLSHSSQPLLDRFYPRLPLGNNYLHIMPNLSQTELRNVYLDQDIITIYPDVVINQSKSLEQSFSTSSYESMNILRTNDTWNNYNITGDGVVIGIVDSGVDFGNSDLQDSPVMLPGGYTASFDATGDGIVVTNTTVSPIQNGDRTFLPIAGFELFGRVGPSNSYASNRDFGFELENLEITGISKPSLSGDYKVGLIIQPSLQQGIPWQIFIFVLTDPDNIGVYTTLYVDMDTSLALSLAYNGLIFESGSTYVTLVDWSLTDEVYYDKHNPIVNRDINGDGVADVSAGALSTSINFYPEISNQIYIRGIDQLGNALVLMYDVIGHGTLTTGAAVSRGKINYFLKDDITTEVIEDNRTYTLPGSAPHAKVIATKGISLTDYILGWYWLAGLEFSITGTLDVEVPAHRADISSNSWGDGSLTNIQNPKGLDLYSMALDMFSMPDTLYPGFPGMIFVVSSGNGGPGYGTVATPGAAPLAITVGASNNYVFLNSSGRDDIAWFTSRGPTAYGNLKPDVVGPGNTGYTTYNVIQGNGNGVNARGLFGGTSEAAPRVAGVIALLVEAIRDEGRNPDLGSIRTILKSTARSVGFQNPAQGSGIPDAYEAVTAIKGGDHLIFSTTVTSEVILSRVASAYESFIGTAHPMTGDLVPDTTVILDDAHLSTGAAITVSYGNGTLVNTSSLLFQASRLIRTGASNFTFSSRSSTQTMIDIDGMLPQSYLVSDLLQISLSLTEDSWQSLLEAGLSTPDLYLLDGATGSYVYDAVTQRSWVQQLYSGIPHVDFIGFPRIQFIDPGFINEVPGWTGLDYLAFAQNFEYRSAPISVSTTGNSLVLTGSQDTYQSGVIRSDNYHIPFLYAPIDDVGYKEQAHTFEVESAFEIPYNLDEAYGALDWGYRPESGDFRYYQFRVPGNATYFALQMEWTEDHFIPDLYLYNDTGSLVAKSESNYLGGGFYQSSTSEDKKQNLFVSADPGIYTLAAHFTTMPFKAAPTQFSLITRYLTLDELPAPVPLFTQDILSPISGIFGLKVENYTIDEFPELDVNAIDMQVVKGSTEVTHGTITVNEQLPGADPTFNLIEHEIPVILNAGDRVTVDLSWPSLADLDIYVLDVDASRTKENDLLGGLGTSPGVDFEHAAFVAPSSGAYIFLVDFIASEVKENIDYTLKITTEQGPTISSDTKSIQALTSAFPNDIYTLKVTFHTNFGVDFADKFIVNFENHELFTSQIISPVTGDTLSGNSTISWGASVAVLADIVLSINNVEYVLTINHPSTSFSFNSARFPNGPATIKVQLSDGIYINEHTVDVILENDNPSSLEVLSTSSNNLNFTFSFVFILLPIFRKKLKEFRRHE